MGAAAGSVGRPDGGRAAGDREGHGAGRRGEGSGWPIIDRTLVC